MTLAMIIYGLLEKNENIVFCAATNNAAKEGLRRFVSLLEENPQPGVTKRDVVLIGNRENLEIDDIISEELFIDNIVNDIFDTCDGWGDSFDEFSLFLKAPVENEIDGNENLYGWYRTNFEEKSQSFYSYSMQLSILAARDISINEYLLKDLQICLKLVKEFEETLEIVKNVYSSNNNHFKSILNRENIHNQITQYLDNIFVDQLDRISRCFNNLYILKTKCQSITKDEFKLKKELCARALVTFSTISTVGSSLFNQVFNNSPVVIVDEAAQVVEAETLILFQYSSIKSIILAGDDKQLSSIVFSKICKRRNYSRSLFARLKHIGTQSILLNIQYRMHSVISKWPSMMFYDDLLKNGDQDRQANWHNHEMFGEFRMIDIPFSFETHHPDTSSKSNLVEAQVIVKMLSKLHQHVDKPTSIGIITFYSAQRELIYKKLAPKGSQIDDVITFGNLIININSVDGFQGQERDIIILSSVRANKSGKVGFLSDQRRLNVALTRGKYSLWIVCNCDTLVNDPSWKKLIQYSKDNGFFKMATSGSEVTRTVAIKSIESNTGFINILDSLWKIQFTKQTKNVLEKLESQEVLTFVDKLMSLSSGISKKKIKDRDGFLQTFPVAKHQVIWSVALDSRKDTYSQVLMIWNISINSNLAELMKNIDQVLCSRTPEYMEACRAREYSDNGTWIPVVFCKSDGVIPFYRKLSETPSNEFLREVDDDITHLVKAFNLDNHVLDAIKAQKLAHLEIPFVMGEEELDLIKHNRSLFILGRSGTGKVTEILIDNGDDVQNVVERGNFERSCSV
jgi:hypothetical protein